jgi:uroporphyrinogen-III synthase
MSISVYISRNSNEIASLISLLEKKGIRIHSQSLISTASVGFKQPIPKTDWIFFSSGNGVRHFFSQLKKIPNTKYAAIGSGTARELSAFVSVDFIGNSIDILENARDFSKLAGAASILFPGAEKSLQNVQSAFTKKQINNLICYRTKEMPINVGFPDILVFSSPSNVRSFFKMNRLLAFQQTIAYGASTAEELKKHGAINVSIPRSLADEAILEAINQVVVS